MLVRSLHFSPRGEAKWVRGPSGRGARRLARAGVLEPYVEHGKQAQRSPGGRIARFGRRVVRNAGQGSGMCGGACPVGARRVVLRDPMEEMERTMTSAFRTSMDREGT